MSMIIASKAINRKMILQNVTYGNKSEIIVENKKKIENNFLTRLMVVYSYELVNKSYTIDVFFGFLWKIFNVFVFPKMLGLSKHLAFCLNCEKCHKKILAVCDFFHVQLFTILINRK